MLVSTFVSSDRVARSTGGLEPLEGLSPSLGGLSPLSKAKLKLFIKFPPSLIKGRGLFINLTPFIPLSFKGEGRRPYYPPDPLPLAKGKGRTPFNHRGIIMSRHPGRGSIFGLQSVQPQKIGVDRG